MLERFIREKESYNVIFPVIIMFLPDGKMEPETQPQTKYEHKPQVEYLVNRSHSWY